GEWVYRDQRWQPEYVVVPANDGNAVSVEIEAQLTAFSDLMGCYPTHLDSHQHVHRDEPAQTRMREIAARLDVPLRHFDPRIAYCGSFYGQSNKGEPYPRGISVEALLGIVRSAPPGITELACHPAANGDMRSTYKDERPVELRTLCDPRVRQAVEALGI